MVKKWIAGGITAVHNFFKRKNPTEQEIPLLAESESETSDEEAEASICKCNIFVLHVAAVFNSTAGQIELKKMNQEARDWLEAQDCIVCIYL